MKEVFVFSFFFSHYEYTILWHDYDEVFDYIYIILHNYFNQKTQIYFTKRNRNLQINLYSTTM